MPDRRILNFVVPLVICNEEGTEINSYWNQEDAERIWAALKHINLLPQPKCMQNGIYDNAYLINHRIPVDNWSLDTMHMWRCLWVELPKRLDFISSILLDNYKFWKDEGKEDERDDIKNTRLPTSLEGFESYWRYNALDIHNTSLDCIMLLQLLTHNKFTWALQNYLLEMQVQSGPCLTMSMRGTHCNLSLQRKFKTELTQDSNDARVVLHKMLGGNLPDFNPNSPTQVKWLIYDVLRAKPATKRAGRSTDQKFLALIQTQSWLLDTVIEQIWKVKKPANNASKYGDLWLPHNRLMYQISIATETERLASKAHQFWCGTNAQNIPKKMRVMLEPDPGYVLWDFDYAQSDAYFTAFTAQDKRFIATMLSDKDTHCLHAEQFFKKPYNELMAGHKIHADWVDHPTKGVRQNTKRIVYGANYMMRGQTLFITMGKHAVVATAQALGLTHADRWSDEKLVALCDKMLSAYFQLYPELAQWLKTQMKVIANEGSLATCCFGYTRYFFGDVLHDQETQRKVAAFYGQGGTAGNINKAMLNIQRELEPQGVELLMQIHDSIVGQVPLESLHLLSDVKRLMENTCKMHGTDFVVPVEGEVGLGWGNRLMAWTPGVTYDAIKKHDDAWWVDLNSNSKGAAA
jgi:DNA polymerase I-like protein with 3'-5' exonuclease and polymerase domains